ncbi:odorant receptor 42a-like [Episyrphus balteatus]|uniref:odorant receptor 42a-like n=1 Tax=Episyrphus balteatus TaxID=286459 RepID=UPI002485501D|nr:odorant receptor 42a-like [Episyrphus balteatus]
MEPFQSIDAFRYFWWNWKVVGLNTSPKYRILNTIYIIFICITGMLFPSLQQIAQSFLVATYAELVSNLSLSLEWACNVTKHFFLIPWFKQIMSAHRYLEPLDIRIQRFDEELKIMRGIVKNCRRLYVAYNVTFMTSLIFYAVNGVVNKKIMFEAYIPWDWKSSTKKYILAFGYQFWTSVVQLIISLAIDNFAICYVYVMWGHLETLAIRISRIGYDRTKSQEDNYKELIACVHDHGNIYQFFELVRPVISGAVLIQFMVTAFALCLAIFDYLFFGSNLAKLLMTLAYVAVLFCQVMPCCYFVNDLMTSSDSLTTALYSSNWMDQTPKFKKTIIIFMQRTQKTTVIMAGNIVPVTLQTCVSIIRFSFSMFTLLKQM